LQHARRRRILRLLATDLSLREIGRELYLSTNTVKTHTRSIYRKLGVSSRDEAVKAARTEAREVRSISPG
jgi:LuxR family transcriptional regulator, maltose regulon positive regulatory protein